MDVTLLLQTCTPISIELNILLPTSIEVSVAAHISSLGVNLFLLKFPWKLVETPVGVLVDRTVTGGPLWKLSEISGTFAIFVDVGGGM